MPHEPRGRTEPPDRAEKIVHLDAQDARGGEIILKSRGRRLIFLAGLAGFVVLAILLRFAGAF